MNFIELKEFLDKEREQYAETISNWAEKEKVSDEFMELIEKMDRRIALTNAILVESNFRDIDIDLNQDTIEHQTGYVWVGDKASISIMKQIS